MRLCSCDFLSAGKEKWRSSHAGAGVREVVFLVTRRHSRGRDCDLEIAQPSVWNLTYTPASWTSGVRGRPHLVVPIL